jgi:CheY-like chemotaxis protein
MSELLESVVGHEATLSFALERDLPPIEGDVSQLCQLVMNLLSNAAEALGERGGRIEIRTGSTDSRRAARGATLFGWDLRPGPCSYLEVGDNGCGMAPATLRRIFDPFFSTKFTGRGLGLAAVMGIARGHRAAFEIESGPGRGTRIRVIFPEARPTRAAVPSAPPEDWRGSGSVLVVDDEQGVRELVQGALERAGLAVVCTGDGRRALEAFREEPDGFDLVLLDGTLPGAGGDATFDALQAVRPEVPVLLMSGFREELATARFAGRELAGFLQKPFEPGALVERVRAVLERAHS